MFVVRWNPVAVRGRLYDLIDQLKAQRESLKEVLGEDMVARIYTNIFGDQDRLTVELEFETLEAAAKFMATMGGDDQEQSLQESGWYEITASQNIEVWQLV